MNDTFLYTLPQWFIFSAVFVSVYGWVEKKKVFRIIGASIFVLLGVYSVYIITGDYLAGAEFFTPDEIADKDFIDESFEEIPFQAKLLPAYISFIFSSILAIPAIILELLNRKKHQLFIILAGLVSLIGFFIIVGGLQHL